MPVEPRGRGSIRARCRCQFGPSRRALDWFSRIVGVSAESPPPGRSPIDADKDSPVPESEGVADAGATADALDQHSPQRKWSMRLKSTSPTDEQSSNGSALDAISQGGFVRLVSVFDGVFGRLGTTETAELLAQLEMEADPELVAGKQVAEGIDTMKRTVLRAMSRRRKRTGRA